MNDTDTAININGDLSRDSSGGGPYYVSGREETAQKLYILLSSRRGGFIYDRELGSDIGLIDTADSSASLRAEACARRALACMPEAEVTGVCVEENGITVLIAVGNEEYSITVRRTQTQ